MVEKENKWRTISMEELWEYSRTKGTDWVALDSRKTFLKPKFPTIRWGRVYTKETTTDKPTIDRLIKLLKEDGHTVRKRIDKKTNQGVFYKIEIKNHEERL